MNFFSGKMNPFLLFYALWCLMCCGVTDAKICNDSKLIIRKSKDMALLKHCKVIEGSLQISLFSYDYEESFPDLVEITGYLLLYRVSGLKSLSNVFPNLTVIRGQELFMNHALISYQMHDLEDLGLYSLRNIKRGSVRLAKNNKMCYVNTVDWSKIMEKTDNNHLVDNKHEAECVNLCPNKCPRSGDSRRNTKEWKPRCWNGEHCQQGVDCPCDYCIRNSYTCCHEYCLGGCTGPKVDDCLACKYVFYNNICRRHCPSGTYMWKERRCLSKDECIGSYLTGDKNARYTLEKKIMGTRKAECVSECPPGYTVKGQSCVECKGSCPKECNGAEIYSIDTAENLKGCTIINGMIKIKIDGGSNIGLELEKSLGAIEVVRDYIKIERSYPLLSLHFFKSLRLIKGEKLVNQDRKNATKYSLVIMDNPNLEELFPPHIANNLRILNGKAKVHFNRKLCFDKIQNFLKLVNITYTETDVTKDTNGDSVPCNITKLKLSVYQNGPRIVLLQWEKFRLSESKMILSYAIYYKQVSSISEKVDILQGRDACSHSVWKKTEREPDRDENRQYMIGLIDNIKPWTTYAAYIKVLTLDSAEKSAVSNVVYFETLPSNPSMPHDLTIEAQEPGELLVQWKPPREPNGRVTHYIVYWQEEKQDSREFDQRDYCYQPIVFKKKKKTQEEIVEEDKQMNETMNEDKCCACPKTIDEIEVISKRRLDQIKFENLLRDLVHLKRPNKHIGRDILKHLSNASLPLPPPSIRGNFSMRQKRHSDSLFNTLEAELSLQNNGFYKTLIPKHNPVVDDLDNDTALNSSDRNEAMKENVIRQVVVNGTQVIIPNLGHFELYNIQVLACLDTTVNGEHYCSTEEVAMADKRTLESPTADNIDPSTISVVVNDTGRVNITWQSPPNPNGLIVSFEIEYIRIGQDNLLPTLPCITHKKYRENNGYISDPLAPGNYTFRIVANSLAGNGSWTPLMSFFIPSPPETGMMQGVTITIITIGVLSLMIVLGIVVWFVAKSKFAKDQEVITTMNPNYMQAAEVYIPDEWEIDRDRIKLVKEIGQGSFGMVWKGLLSDKEKGLNTRVAVKVVNERASLYDKMNFLKEASIMKKFQSYHVVQLLGVVSQGGPAYVVMELMLEGDLKNFLRNLRPESDVPDKGPPPSLKEIIQMMGEIADGMAYLADKKFVHRDLAARNCMVSETRTVKIGDFGMTRDIYETDYYRKGRQGLLPVRWMSPESLKDGLYSTMSDVWSFGIVLWEMATLAAQPYQGLSNEEVLKYVCDGRIMEKPKGCPDVLYNIMLKCWKYKVKYRPTFKDIIEIVLSDLNQQFQDVSYYFSDENKPDSHPEFVCIQESFDASAFRDEEDYDYQDDSTIPFIDQKDTEKVPRTGHAMLMNDSDPCECMLLEEFGAGQSSASGRGNNMCQSSSSSKESSKSSDSSRNGFVNGHLRHLPHASSC